MKRPIASMIAKLNATLSTTKVGLGVLAFLSGGTALALLPHAPAPTLAPAVSPSAGPAVAHTNDQGLSLKVKPSQSKVVQGYGDEVYLDVEITVPQAVVLPTMMATTPPRKPTDMVLVLDRSGSMADEHKLEYAKAAMVELVSHFGEQDRVGLVTFDDRAVDEFPIAAATPESRSRLIARIRALGPGGGTNMGDGLERGRAMLGTPVKGRSERLVLLSDGMANIGVATPEGLTGIVKSISRTGAVVSTIGMGNDFNEAVLARLADHGMGSYTYVASNDRLGELLEKNLGDAREQFAAASFLLLDVGPGVTVADAAGYPIESEGGKVRVPLGALLEGTTRSLTIAMRAPFQSLGAVKLAGVELTYERESAHHTVTAGDAVALQVVAPERAPEATASVDSDVLKNAWTNNNIGRMKKEFGDQLRNGNQEEARRVIANYRAKANAAAGGAGMKPQELAADGELQALEGMASDAFQGSGGEQAEKQKAYAKAAFSSGVADQRKTVKVKP